MFRPIPLFSVLVLAIAYILPGLVGHEPWKQDENYIFGIVYHMLQSGDWVVPQNAGEPFMEKPPLYYWVAAGLAWLNRNWLPLPDGARLASGLFTSLTLLFTGLTARHCWGAGTGRYAVIALMASFGLLYESHFMIADVPMLTGFTIACYGFALSLQRPLRAGLWLGIGTGIGFLAKGLLIPGAISVIAILLPALFANWRRREYVSTLIVAGIVCLPALLIWPVALYLRSPRLFYDWFWLNNVGRFLGFSVPQLGADNSVDFWPRTLPWFTFPVLPLALVSLWQQRKQLPFNPSLQLGLVAFLTYALIMQFSASARTAYGLPMLTALALLGAPAVLTLPRRINRYGDYFSRLLFAPLVVVSWYVWGQMALRSSIPKWPMLERYFPMDFHMPLQWLPVMFALSATLIYFLAWFRLPRLASRAVTSLALGVTIFWIMFGTLWLPWVDYAKSYRSVFISMRPYIPALRQCVASEGLGESTRPMLEYYLGILTLRRELHPGASCDVLIIDGRTKPVPQSVGSGWKLIWSGTRPGDDEEEFRLYVKSPATGITKVPSV
ncbi:MAG: ArnT family glycosyltransferase [Burkholderiales bacterium]